MVHCFISLNFKSNKYLIFFNIQIHFSVVPSSFQRNEFRSGVLCGKRFCVLGCICSSLNLLKPRSQRCIHLECMFDHKCIIKSKLPPSPATKDEDDSCECLPQQRLPLKEIELRNIIEFVIRNFDVPHAFMYL